MDGRRGLVGWVTLGLFLLWNALMLFAALGALADGKAVPDEPAMAAAQSVGSALGLRGVLLLWAAGAAILGLAAYLTRGAKAAAGSRSG